jgi:hypothetical protein
MHPEAADPFHVNMEAGNEIDNRVTDYLNVMKKVSLDTKLDEQSHNSSLRQKFLETLSASSDGSETREDEDIYERDINEDDDGSERDQTHSISYGYSKHDDDDDFDDIFDLSDEDEDEVANQDNYNESPQMLAREKDDQNSCLNTYSPFDALEAEDYKLPTNDDHNSDHHYTRGSPSLRHLEHHTSFDSQEEAADEKGDSKSTIPHSNVVDVFSNPNPDQMDDNFSQSTDGFEDDVETSQQIQRNNEQEADEGNDPFGFDQVSVEEVEQDEPHTPNEDHTSQLLEDHHQDGNDEAKVLDAFNDPFGFDQVSVEEVEQDEPHTPNEDHTSQLLQDHHQDGLENMSLNEHSLREGDENQHVQVEQQSFGNTDIFMDSAVSLDETNEGANTSDVFDSIPESEMSSNDVKLDQAASTEIRSNNDEEHREVLNSELQDIHNNAETSNEISGYEDYNRPKPERAESQNGSQNDGSRNDSQNDSLEDLLEEYSQEKKVDLYASFNAHSSPDIFEASSSLSSTPSHFMNNNDHVIATSDETFPDQNNFPHAIYSSENAKSERSNFAGNRLYNQGIQKQRKEAISRNYTHAKTDRKLNLSTRAYNERSATNTSSRNGSTSVYNRLYEQTRQKPPVTSMPTRRSISRINANQKSDSVYSRLYYSSKKTNVENDESITAVQSVYRSTSRTRSRNRDGMTASERLYNLAKKKRVLELEREKKRRDAELAKQRARSQSRSKSSSSPAYGQNNVDIYNRLYHLAKAKKDTNDEQISLERERKAQEVAMKTACVGKRNARDAHEGFSRLFSVSARNNSEGRKRRQEIEKKNRPRQPTPSRKISAKDASQLYNRGMVQKMNLELRKEDEGINMNYISPLLNPLVETDEDRSKSVSRSSSRQQAAAVTHCRTSSRIRTRSRLRAQSPSIRSPFSRTSEPATSSMNRSCTPNPSTRNSTPNRRLSSVVRNSRTHTPIREGVIPNTRTRSLTPSRVRRDSTPMRKQKQNSTRQMLRNLETQMHNSMKSVNGKIDADTVRSGSTKATSSSSEKTSFDHRVFLTPAKSQDYVF